MFYPELSPAMRWQLEQHQKMYSMYHSMGGDKMAMADQYGECRSINIYFFHPPKNYSS